MEARPTPVLEAKQVGEVQARWAWTEPTVWTERMLTALELGVKGGIWFSLIDKVYKPRNLRAAFAQVKANQGAAGVDHQTIEMFAADLDTIRKEKLLERVAEKVADSRVLELIEAMLQTEVMDGLAHWTPEAGTPQGAVISPLLSNIYLDPLDHEVAHSGYEMVRYADDFVILCRSETEARAALAKVQQWTATAGLRLHPEKTRIVDATQGGGFDFLGYHFERGYRWPRRKSVARLKATIRNKTRRTHGHSMRIIIKTVNQTLTGWFGYFKHSHKTAFPPLDQWIRMRLRTILRQRRKGKGRARGADHVRWPNAFFATQGLLSLSAACAQYGQSSRR